jgi:hypothetical protein
LENYLLIQPFFYLSIILLDETKASQFREAFI